MKESLSRSIHCSFRLGRQKVSHKASPPKFRRHDESASSSEHAYSMKPTTQIYRTDQDDCHEFNRIPLMNANLLATKFKERPRRVKMLSRDFIDDSLYNPHYGYFSKQAVIFSPEQSFDYAHLDDTEEFINQWTKIYRKQRDQVAKVAESNQYNNAATQLWHTPVELFKPYYGEALARYLVIDYKLTLYPYRDLIIYEMGGGNGTLMETILNYLREHHYDIYTRTKYNIIEISESLAQVQKRKALEAGHAMDKVNIINESIFKWGSGPKNSSTKPPHIVQNECYFIALEVFDNFSHDVIRYDLETRQPFQGYVMIDKKGDFFEYFSPHLDKSAEEFIQLRRKLVSDGLWTPLRGHPLLKSPLWSKLKSSIVPFFSYPLSEADFIPTRYLEFIKILRDRFPNHRLLTSDFTSLPDAISGYNAPVVQTMIKGQMVTTSTYMVHQGFVDILFPTDFSLAAALYYSIVGKTPKVAPHSHFLADWADIEATTTKTGDNPMLSIYENAAFMYS